MTVLMGASRNGETDTVVLLLQRGANIEAKNNVRTPQHNTMFQSMSL
jgi:ankyrin repeat protein